MTTATYDTTERYIEFVNQVASNPELSRQLEAVSDSAGMVELAAANGFIFTADELKSAAHTAKVMVEYSEGELSEEALELVAGGFPGLSTLKKGLHYLRKAIDYIDDKIN